MKLTRSCGAVAVLGILWGVPSIWAQSLGGVAREDRERRLRLSTHSPVLTNEDLARERILTPQLKNQIQAAYEIDLAAPPAPHVTGLALRVHPPIGYVPPEFRESTEQVETRIAAVMSVPHRARAHAGQQPTVVPPKVIVPAPTAAEIQEPVPVVVAEVAPVVRHVPDLSSPVTAVDQWVSLGEHARQLRLQRAARAQVDIPAPAMAEAAPTPEISPEPQAAEVFSLGEYARQLRAHRNIAGEPTIAPPPPAIMEAAHDAGNPVSLGDFARQLLQERIFAEAPSVAPPPAVLEATNDPANNLSLGEYARQLRALRQSRFARFDSTPVVASEIEINPQPSGVMMSGTSAQSQPEPQAQVRRNPATPVRPHPAWRYLSRVADRSIRAQRITRLVMAAADRNQTPTPHLAVTVRRGDSLWRLARTYLGSGAQWRRISLRHHHSSPDLIHEGDVVLIPFGDVHFAQKGEAHNLLSLVSAQPTFGLSTSR